MHLLSVNNTVSWVQSCQLLFVLPSVTWRKGLRGERWSLWQCNDSLETYTSCKWYQQRRVPAGPRCDTWQPDMDVQLWAIGKMCPVTAGRPHPDHSRSVQALIPPLSPWSHACLSATCLPLPLISAQSALSSCLVFVSASLKAPTAAGEPTLISGAVVSRLVLMLRVSGYVWERERKKKKDSSRLDNAAMFVCTKSSVSAWVFVVSLQTALAPKHWLKSEKHRSLHLLPVIIAWF